MKKIVLRSLVLFAAGAAAIPAARSAPVKIESESAAKAALAVPVLVVETVPNDLLVLAAAAQQLADISLTRLRAVATPAQLTAASAGIEVGCAHAGSFIARETAPKTISLTFTDCARTLEGLVWSWTGVAQIVLTSNSFTPDSVASISLGNAEQDQVEKFYFLDSPASFNTSRRNLRIVGQIPLLIEADDFGFRGPFRYKIDGFLERANPTQAADGSSGSFGTRYTAGNLQVSGHRYEWWLGEVQVTDFSTNYKSGSLNQTYFDTLAGVNDTRAVVFDALQVNHRTVSQLNDNVASIKVDGNADITWAAVNGSGCRSGSYDVHTVRPLIFVNDSGNYSPDDGELRINDDLVARFSGPPQPTIRLNVRNVGNFRYRESITAVTSSLPCGF
jgi:hypothetical protein